MNLVWYTLTNDICAEGLGKWHDIEHWVSDNAISEIRHSICDVSKTIPKHRSFFRCKHVLFICFMYTNTMYIFYHIVCRIVRYYWHYCVISMIRGHTHMMKQWSLIFIFLQACEYLSSIEEAFLNTNRPCYDWPRGAYSEITYKQKLRKWHART